MRKVRTTLMALAILAAITGIVSASENLLQNGGFETGSFSAWDTSLNLYATLPEWSTPEIVTSPVYSGTYAAYFECKDQQYYNWWPGSGHVDQARQTIPNVNYNKLQNMVFDVWTKYDGSYSTWIHAASLGSVDFVVYDASNNPISRYVVRHTAGPGTINAGVMQLTTVPGCFRTYTSGSGWTHSVVDIGSELVNSPTCGIPAEKQGDVDHVDVVIYTFSYGFGNGDAKIYVDDLAVYSTNEPTTAYIDSITPNPAVYGEEVSFTGHGLDIDGSVVAHQWRSSIDGVLSTYSSFSTSSLSLGNHIIYFKVLDDKGDWSGEVSEGLSVVCPTPEEKTDLGNYVEDPESPITTLLNQIGAAVSGHYIDAMIQTTITENYECVDKVEANFSSEGFGHPQNPVVELFKVESDIYRYRYIETSPGPLVSYLLGWLKGTTIEDLYTNLESPVILDSVIMTDLLNEKKPKLKNYPLPTYLEVPMYPFTELITVWSPVDILLRDQEGRKVGTLYENGTLIGEINEIPDIAVYTGSDTEPEFIAMIDPPEGYYEVEVHGLENGTYDMDITRVINGTSEFEEIHGDIAINQNSTHYYQVLVDITSPNIDIVSPPNGSFINSKDVTIVWDSSDNFDIDHYDLFLDEVLQSTITETDKTLKNLGEGLHTVEVNAFDLANNSASDSVSFTIDTAPACEMKTDYEEGVSCSGTFYIDTLGDIDAYVASNFGKGTGNAFKHVKIRENLINASGDIVLHSPCQISLKDNVVLTAVNICLDGRKGVLDDNGYTVNADKVAVLSELDNAGFGQGSFINVSNSLKIEALKTAKIGIGSTVDAPLADLSIMSTGELTSSHAMVKSGCTITANNLWVESSKTAKIGENNNLNLAGDLTILSTGDFSSSDALIRARSIVSADNINLSASRTAKFGDNTQTTASNNVTLWSTGTATGSEALMTSGAKLSAFGSFTMTSGNKAKLGLNVNVTVSENFHMEAATPDKCTIKSSAAYNASSTSGNCLS